VSSNEDQIRIVPLGRPIDGARIYLLDALLQRCLT